MNGYEEANSEFSKMAVSVENLVVQQLGQFRVNVDVEKSVGEDVPVFKSLLEVIKTIESSVMTTHLWPFAQFAYSTLACGSNGHGCLRSGLSLDGRSNRSPARSSLAAQGGANYWTSYNCA